MERALIIMVKKVAGFTCRKKQNLAFFGKAYKQEAVPPDGTDFSFVFLGNYGILSPLKGL